MTKKIAIQTSGQGLHEITNEIRSAAALSGVTEGLCTVMIMHTSASLTIQENADPSARRDLESWMNRLVQEDDADYTHTAEGPDDMPSHIKSALTSTTLSIPILDGELGLGTWQGIFLWEHRRRPYLRNILVHVGP